jgi:hypothetical protein
METKMKKIPFDLELAKKGEAFRTSKTDKEDTFYIGEFDDSLFFWWIEDGVKEWNVSQPDKEWHHLIPDEPKPERWATVHKNRIFNSEQEAKDSLFHPWENVVVVKLAE